MAIVRLAELPKLPSAAAYLWRAFLDLHKRGRESGGMGPGRISYRTLNDWSAATYTRLSSWERDAIFRLDDAWAADQAQQQAAAK